MNDETQRVENRGGDRYPQDKSNSAEWLSQKGGVRCGRVRKNGTRCKRWAAIGYMYCKFHGATSTGSDRGMYDLGSEEANESFLKFRNKEDYLSVTDELAVIRFCMEQLLKNAKERAKKKDGTYSDASVAMIAEMSKNVTQVAKDCNTIERGLSLHISVETLEMWLGQIVDTLAEAGASEEFLTTFIELAGKTQLPVGGRKSLRDMVEEDDAAQAKREEKADAEDAKEDKDLYDDSDEEVNAETKETTANVSKPTETPDALSDRPKRKKKKKRKKKGDGPRNERDEPRGDKPRKNKRRGLTVRRK